MSRSTNEPIEIDSGSSDSDSGYRKPVPGLKGSPNVSRRATQLWQVPSAHNTLGASSSLARRAITSSGSKRDDPVIIDDDRQPIEPRPGPASSTTATPGSSYYEKGRSAPTPSKTSPSLPPSKQQQSNISSIWQQSVAHSDSFRMLPDQPHVAVKTQPTPDNTAKGVQVIDKCNRCREAENVCTGERPACNMCKKYGYKCVYGYDDDAALNRIISGVHSKYTPAPDTNSEVEYYYASHSEAPESSGSEVLSRADNQNVEMPTPKAKAKPKTLEDVLFAYLGEDDPLDDDSMEVDDPEENKKPIEPEEIETLVAEMRSEMDKFQETTVKASLRASMYRSKIAPRPTGRSTKGNPFDRLFPQTGPSKVRLLTKTKGATKWDPLSVAVSACPSKVVSLPKSKSIGRVGPSLLSQNSSIGKYHPYEQEDETAPAEALSAKYQEVRERYHDYQSISASWAGQRTCTEIVYRTIGFVQEILERVGITPADVVCFFLQPPSKTEAIYRNIDPADLRVGLSVEKVLSTQTRSCQICQISPQVDASGRRLRLREGLPELSPDLLHKIAAVANFFRLKFEVSLWHVVSLEPSEVHLITTEDQIDKEEVEQICLICGLHCCMVHGAFVEDWQLAGYQDRFDADDGPVRLNDAEKKKNERWLVSTWANPLRPDQHVCSVFCEDAEGTKIHLKEFRGRQTDASISGFVSFAVKRMTPYLADDEMCSDFCFWDVERRSQQLPVLTPSEQELFDSAVKGNSVNPRGPCMMRDYLSRHKCRELFALMVSRTRQVPHPLPESISMSRKTAKAKLNSKLDLSMNHQIADRKAFFPCDHAGPCSLESDCDCWRQKIACEAHCKCDNQCERRFRGCSCHISPGQVCGDKHCACWNAGRECDPRLCKGCGVETVLHQAYKYKPEMRIGRCRNCRVQLELPARTIKAPSEVQGYGLFAGEDLKRGDFIHEYKGEIISQTESDRRGAMYSLSGQEYLFNLNAEQQIDANNFGNKSRFMNNSRKEANINVYGHTVLCRGQHRVGLFAKRDIKKGEELLYDYEYPAAVANRFWERGEKSAKSKAQIDTPVIARASRGSNTKTQAKKKKTKKTRQRPRYEGRSQSPLVPLGQGRKKQKGVLGGSSRARVGVSGDDLDAMDVDEVALGTPEVESDYEEDVSIASEGESESDNESESEEEEDEIPESDAEMEDSEPTPLVRKGSTRGRGKGSRGRGRGKR